MKKVDNSLLSHIPRKPELPDFLSHRKFLPKGYSKANNCTPCLLYRHFLLLLTLLGENYRESSRTGSTGYRLRGRTLGKELKSVTSCLSDLKHPP